MHDTQPRRSLLYPPHHRSTIIALTAAGTALGLLGLALVLAVFPIWPDDDARFAVMEIHGLLIIAMGSIGAASGLVAIVRDRERTASMVLTTALSGMLAGYLFAEIIIGHG